MANRNGSSSGRGRKKGLLGAVRRHPLRTAGIAAGAVLGLAILRKATNGDDSDRGDAADGGAARKTAGRARGRRAAARGTSARGTARGGRAGARARGGRSQARAETGRTE